MIVEEPSILNPHPLEFERFLYASVGKDRNDYIVTVLTTFARLGLDPWKETSELVAMERDPARLRLGLLLARFRDVPALASGHARIAGELSMLLTDSPSAGLALQPTRAISTGLSGLGGTFWMTLAIVSSYCTYCFWLRRGQAIDALLVIRGKCGTYADLVGQEGHSQARMTPSLARTTTR